MLDKHGDQAEFMETVRKKAYEYDFNCHGRSQAVAQSFLDIFEKDNALL